MASIAVVGDFDPASETHAATNAALDHAAGAAGADVDVEWFATDGAGPHGCDGILVAPGSPYRSMDGALRAITAAREGDTPLLGTCGGFQHVVIEYSRSVLGLADAGHAEYDDRGSCLVVAALACSLAGQTRPVRVRSGSRAHTSYGTDEVAEPYRCSYGLSPQYRSQLEDRGLVVSGEDEDGEARIVELPQLRFFIATLYVPQLRSTPDEPHPLFTGLLGAIEDGRNRETRAV